jgi:uncharacterized protein (TIGR03435 family)
MSVRPATPFGALLIASAAFAQTAAVPPQFEAAAIRLATITTAGPVSGARRRIDASRVEFLGATLPQLIRNAYRLEPYQTVTGPDWMKKTYFDVFAKLPGGAIKGQIPEMLQALLADQLKLVVRRESREEAVCVLSVGKNGPKLKEVPADVTPELFPAHSDGRAVVLRTRGPDGYLTYSRLNGTVILEAMKITLPDLAIALRNEVKMPVLDRTGLQGFYEVSLFVPGTLVRPGPRRAGGEESFGTPDAAEAPVVPVAAEPEGVNLFKSIQRLGLKLEKSKAPIEHLVVESAEQRPVERE